MLDIVRGGDSLDQPRGEVFPPCQVDDLHRRTIHAVRKEQDLKIRTLYILLCPGLGQRHTGIRLQVNAEMVHGVPPSYMGWPVMGLMPLAVVQGDVAAGAG